MTEPENITEQPLDNRTRRLGKSPFWIQLSREQYAASDSKSWRASITHRPARTRKIGMDVPILDISPRHPLFTLSVAGESFPLLIDRCDDLPRARLKFSGIRKMMLKSTHVVEWTATVRAECSRTGAHMRVDFKANVQPPLPPRTPTDVRIELFSPMYQPEPWSFPYAPEAHHGAILLWGAQSGVSASLVTSGARNAGSHITHNEISATALVETFPAAIRRSRGGCSFFIRFDVARSRTHAQLTHLRHTAATLPPALPDLVPNRIATSLRENAERALHRLTDKGTYDVIGVERVYVKSQGMPGLDGSAEPEFSAGFPHFPIDAARAMMDWDLLVGDHDAARLALLIARGIATDFGVIKSDGATILNKGAFWDRRGGAVGSRHAAFTDFVGDDFHSIASTARIAQGLFGIYERTNDLASLNAALSACQWLILKQNSHGYYDGDRVCASTGAVIGGEETLSGIAVVPPLLQAYRATKNEVFVKAGMRVMRHITTQLMPHLVACPIYRARRLANNDTPVSVASLIRSLYLVNSQIGTRRTREELEIAGIWLRAWDMSHLDHDGLNNDGAWDGLCEIVRAALRMAVVDKSAQWLSMALRLSAQIPECAADGWHALPIFAETMLTLTALLPRGLPDLIDYTARIDWTDFTPDSSTSAYIAVHAAGDSALPVDFLPLVSRIDSRVLIPVLAQGPVESITITQNGNQPNVRDLITGDIVCQPAPLHRLLPDSPARWGCFTISP